MRNMQKALLNALLTPNALLKKLQDEGRFSEKMALSEEIKTLPFGDVWKKFCLDNGVIADESWFKVVEEYENEVLLKRN
jgi:L-rhamnose isomerase